MKAPLLEELFKYHNEKNLMLSMPGNKCGLGFEVDSLGREFMNRMGKLDITEVDPLDNLHCPEGIIDDAQKLLARTYKSKRAYFLVNGSSGGNLSAVFACFSEGDEVIVERNCHKSIYNAAILRKLKISYIEPVIDYENGIFMPPDRKNIYKAFDNCSSPKGIILTYPNYFGITYDIEDIIYDLKSRGLKIILDCAHGAHLGITKKLPKSMAHIGDYVVLSAHKTLPALTQGSYMTVNDENADFEFYLRVFMTTSPSYLIMASLDYARYYMDRYGERDYEILIDKSEDWKNKINSLGKVKILSQSDIKKYGEYDVDKSRYVIVLPKGYSGHKLLDYFREKKIQCEMSFSQGVVFILSPFFNDEDFRKIYNALLELDLNAISDSAYAAAYESVIPEKILEPHEAFVLPYETVGIDKSRGKISKDFITPYPPGIPLVCPGELISDESLHIINDYIDNGKDIIGVDKEERKIKIISKYI
ncbi:MAG: aminotransferase class I/II-fold pyridoxal phosphate-dependent enzyme [Clostridium sp.]